MTTNAQHTPVTFEKCGCGHRACKQYILSTQGSVGFSLEDAQLYAAAPELLEALHKLSFAAQITGGTAGRDDRLVQAIDFAAAAILKATGEPK